MASEQIMTIYGWNPVWRACAVKADTEALMPSFLFKPNIALLDLLQQSSVPNQIIEIDVAGTNSLYDGIQKVVIDKSNVFGGDRPNYYATKHMYIATLINRDWFSYPPVNGVFRVRTGVFDSYTTDPVPEERLVRIIDPNGGAVENFRRGDGPLVLNTAPSLGAVANAAYDAAVAKAAAIGAPTSYVYNNPPRAEHFVCDRCPSAAGPCSLGAGNVAYNQDATIERFETSSSQSSMRGGRACGIVAGLMLLGFLFMLLMRKPSS